MIKKRNLIRLFILLILVLLSVGFYPVKINFLKSSITSPFNRIDGFRIETGDLRLALFKGFVINEVRLELYRENNIEVNIPVVFLNYRIMPFYSNYSDILREIREIFRNKKRGFFKNCIGLFYESETAEALKKVRLKGVEIILPVNKKRTGIKGANILIDFTHRKTREVVVSIKADSVISDKGAVSDVAVRSFIKDRRFCLDKFTGSFYGGKIDVNCEVDLEKGRINEGDFKIKGLDLESYYKTNDKNKGVIKGEMNANMKFESSGLSLETAVLTGNMDINNIYLSGVPLFDNAVISRALPLMKSIKIERLTGDVSFREGNLYSENISGEGDPMDIALNGWVNLEQGVFRYDVRGVFEPGYKKNVRPLVWNTLIPADKDRRIMYSTLSGTFYDPVVIINRQHGSRAIKNVFRGIGDGIKSIFR